MAQRFSKEQAWQTAFRAKRVAKRVLAPYRDVATLVDHRLFDHHWYNHVSGLDLSRTDAAKHYLTQGRKSGFTPHPLFDGDYFEERSPELIIEGVDPFLRYIRGRCWMSPVHPNFPVHTYVWRNPLAMDHSAGPIGHYEEFGAPLGARANHWYVRDPEVEPRGLIDWLWKRVDEYRENRKRPYGWWGPAAPFGEVPATGVGTVSVIVAAAFDAAVTERMVGQALAQPGVVEVLVAPTADIVLDFESDERVRVLDGADDIWAARNQAAAEATGDWLVFPDEADSWAADRLARLTGAVAAGGWGHDIAENVSDKGRFLRKVYDRDAIIAGAPIELGAFVVARELFEKVGGFNPKRHHAAAEQFLADLTRTGEGTFVPALGTTFDGAARKERLAVRPGLKPWLDHDDVPAHHDEVLNDVMIDWAAAAERETDPDCITIIVPTYADRTMTDWAVEWAARKAQGEGENVEILVVDNGCAPNIAIPLKSLERFDFVRVINLPRNYGFALANNIALAQAKGSTILFLNNDTEISPGWLKPVREAMADPHVLAAQSLLVYDTGAIQSAGVAFSASDSPPHAVLQGYPREDAVGLAGVDLTALTGAALAARYEDLVKLRGFDAVFRNGMEDVDLCLRLAELRPGACRLLPDSHVIHLESRTPGRFTHSLINRKVFLERWGGRLPVDDTQVWGAAGYTVTGRAIRQRASDDNRVNVLEPVVERTVRAQVSESAPRLRWAIKNPAPYGIEGQHWGDTYYAKHLAESLERLGQDVIVDYRPEFERETARHDDVVLLLRGLAPLTPRPGQVSMMWIISHPEMLAQSDGRGWDRIYVASSAYAPKLAAQWDRPVAPLFQATDPSRFHPDVAEADTGYPLLFLGSSRNQARPMVMDSIERNLGVSVIGKDWDQFVPPGVVRSEFMANDEIGAAYRAAGILLNDHWDDMREEGFISNRLFDAVAAGARVITDDVVGLREIFGKSVQVANNADELEALVRAENRDEIFGTDEERRAAAAVIAREHSFDARAAVLLEDAVASWRQRQGQ